MGDLSQRTLRAHGTMIGFAKWVRLTKAAGSSWLDDRCPTMGAAIAYYTVFSLAPMLVLVIAIAGLAFGRAAAEGALLNELSNLVGTESGIALQAMIRNASGLRAGILAGLLSLMMLLVAATAVFEELQASLNVIWKVEPPKRVGIWRLLRSRLLSLSLIIAIGFLLLVSLIISAALTAFSDYLARTFPALPYVLRILHLTFSFGVITALFAMMFKVLPDTNVKWRDVWFGAALTALLFTIGKYLISLYIGSSNVASTYGAAGGLVILLLWIYYSAQIFLFGAEFAKACGDQRTHRPPAKQTPNILSGRTEKNG